jgi:hypothetical protein
MRLDDLKNFATIFRLDTKCKSICAHVHVYTHVCVSTYLYIYIYIEYTYFYILNIYIYMYTTRTVCHIALTQAMYVRMYA